MSDYRRHMKLSRKSSILLGIASIFDFTGRLGPRYRPIQNPLAEDTVALARDWQTVGDDMRKVMANAHNLKTDSQ